MAWHGSANGGVPPAPSTVRGNGCKRCEYCFSKLYGCTDTACYCHTHRAEPVDKTAYRDLLRMLNEGINENDGTN